FAGLNCYRASRRSRWRCPCPSTTPPLQDRCCVFFFQAEAGIRDLIVTGVQTCALPILGERRRHFPGRQEQREVPRYDRGDDTDRSEERRVGKECRSRGGPER